MTVKKLTACAIMTCVCLVLSYVEHLLPLSLAVPVPGIKLGLSNIVILALLACFGIGCASAVMLLKCLLSSFFFGSVTSLIFSVAGGALSLLVMFALMSLPKNRISVFGVSVAGAVFHNIGQLAAACAVLRSAAVFSYLPLLAVSGVVMGIITGAITSRVLHLLGYERGKPLI